MKSTRTLGIALLLLTSSLCPACGGGSISLRVMNTGVGGGSIAGTGIACGNGGSDCNETYTASTSVTLTATPLAGSTFSGWGGDCSGSAMTCTVTVDAIKSVRAAFDLSTPITPITNFAPDGPGGLGEYLSGHAEVNSPARFINALPQEFKQNWLLMPRSESLQTGNADSPRILMPSADAERVFTVGMTTHASYPGSHPNAVEYMQWDPAQKNFRFHEIVLADIDPMGDVIDVGPPEVRRFPARTRGVKVDEPKCFNCHSSRNVLNRGMTPGTDGLPPGSVKAKNKPNWDTYDSWGGMLAFNRDRIYQGSVEAAAFRKTFNLWTWQTNDAVRSVIEQLELQPPGVPANHAITRLDAGGPDDGHISFGFDLPGMPVQNEPAPTGTEPSITTAYEFNRAAGTGAATSVVRQGEFVTLHQSTQVGSDEGRGVELFDRLSANPNPLRIADEVVNHRVATGNVAIDVRPIALAIAQGCITVDGGTTVGSTQSITSVPALSGASTAAFAFFNSRHGLTSFNQVYDDTRLRSWSLTLRKADIQKITFDRSVDPYAYDSDLSVAPPPPPIIDGLIQRWGATTSAGTSVTLERMRQEVFRRSIGPGGPDNTVMMGIYVDREIVTNTEQVALFRYFLEPLGVSVDKWSMGVRGRSRTYTFADVFGGYTNTIAGEMKSSLGIPSSTASDDVCDKVIPLVDATLASLPAANATPTYTDVQRIFNKGCIECHGGLGYPPYHTYGTYLNFAEDENPPAMDRRMTRSYNLASSLVTADPNTSFLYRRITDRGNLAHPYKPDEPYNMANPDDPSDPDVLDERCPSGLMPCGGPPLSKVDIETIRRWIVGGSPYTEGDPHLKTVNDVSYDFQSAGEFVLLRDEGMELQARQTPVTTAGPLGPNGYTGLSTCASINTAVAMRVGAHRVTYQPGVRPGPLEVTNAQAGGLILRVDGSAATLGAQGIPLASGGRIVRTTAPGGIQVEYPGGTVVVVTPAFWTNYQLWYMNIDVRHSRATEGVMGTIDGGNWLPALPDGTIMGSRPAGLPQRYQDLYEKFADGWRVTDATTLFDYDGGLSTASFTVDAWPMQSPRSCSAPVVAGGAAAVTPQTPMTQAQAEKVCAAIVDPNRKANCIQDVMATGEAGFAETYLATERIERHTPPKAPTLESPADNSDVGGGVRFTWEDVRDAAGGPVTYRHCVWDAKRPFDFNRCQALSDRPVTDQAVTYAGFVLIIGLLLLLALFFIAAKHRRLVLIAVAIAIVPAALLAFYLARSRAALTPTSAMAQLEPGGVYFWKVIAEDGEGGMVESETYRFTVK
jgi:hypothetical protein